MDVLFVAALRAFAGARTRHQFGRRARRPKLDYLAQGTLTETASLLFLQYAILDLRQRPES